MSEMLMLSSAWAGPLFLGRHLAGYQVLVVVGLQRRRSGLHEARAREHAGLLEDRVSDRADVRIDALEVGDEVEVERRSLDAFERIAGKAPEVRVRIRPLEVAEQHLLREELLCTLQVPVQEHAHAQPQVGDEPGVQVADLRHARVGEAPVLADLLVDDVGEHALDDVAHLLEVDRERDDVGPAPAFLLVERLARDLGEVEFDGGVEVVDDVVLLPICAARVRSLDLMTCSMPFSMSSTTSPMRIASRAALAMASGGVSSADGSRLRGLAGSSASGLVGQQALGHAGDLLGPEDEQERQEDVEEKVEQHDFARRVELEARDPPSTYFRMGMASTQPMSLNRKLPSVTRRASGGARNVDSMPRMPLPRLAPSTSPSATGSEIIDSEASVAISSTTGEARIAQDREHRGDEHVEQHVARQRGEDHLHTGGLHERLGRDRDPLQREDDEPEADEDAAEAPDVGRLLGEEQRDADEDESGASQDRSNDRITVTSDVPTSAPSITASAGAVLMRPCPANAATISAVAVLLWMRPVTPRPAKNAEKRWLMLLRRNLRRSAPYRRRMPVRTMCVPQTRSATPASRLSRVCI
jgi:hypothetical protein